MVGSDGWFIRFVIIVGIAIDIQKCKAFTTLKGMSIAKRRTMEKEAIVRMSAEKRDGKEWEELDFEDVVERYFDTSGGEEEQGLELEDERWMLDFLGDLEEVEEGQEIALEEKDVTNAHNVLLDALQQGVVPTDAGVGSENLPGDYGFDPLGLATRDYITTVQRVLLRMLPGSKSEIDPLGTRSETRPQGLILRDYREAEIRNGRLAMLAAVIWPLQEIIDHLIIPSSSAHTTMVYGGATLPYLSLIMTLFMLLLGYLDIYAQVIKQEDAGEAFLPGECFWDPLSILDGTSQRMKWLMQETELRYGRFAMVAVFSYFVQEAFFHKALVSLPWNMFFFQPFYTIPELQHWFDLQFQTPSPIFRDIGEVDFIQIIQSQDVVVPPLFELEQ